MEKISPRKQLTVIRLYLQGFSYGEIASKAGVAKGTITNVISALKSGQIPDVREASDQIDMLRELATDLHQLGMSAGEAVTGLTVLRYIGELGLHPGEITAWATMCRELAAREEQGEVDEFVQAAIYLNEFLEETGCNPAELEEKAQKVREDVKYLEERKVKLSHIEQQLNDIEKRQASLSGEVSLLVDRKKSLNQDIATREKRETKLQHRVDELEKRAHTADQKLTRARKGLEDLFELGLSFSDLTVFVRRMEQIAAHHGVSATDLRDWLFEELEDLDKGLNIKWASSQKAAELERVEQRIGKARQEYKSLEAAVQQLQQEQDKLRQLITEEEQHVRKAMQSASKKARDSAEELRSNLKAVTGAVALEVRGISEEALRVGEELGRFNATVEANTWVQVLSKLMRGEDDIVPAEVRAALVTVLGAMVAWLQRDQGQMSQHDWLISRLNNAKGELERWKESKPLISGWVS